MATRLRRLRRNANRESRHAEVRQTSGAKIAVKGYKQITQGKEPFKIEYRVNSKGIYVLKFSNLFKEIKNTTESIT